MAVIVKIANALLKAKDKDFVSEYLNSLGEDWNLFVDGELKKSNETNTKSLGGQQPRPCGGSDDDDMDSSTSMDAILSRFSNFNTAMSQKANSQQDDDEDEDEDEDNNENHQDGDDRDNILKARDQEYQRPGTPIIIPTVLAKEEPIVKEFADNNYWKVPLPQEKSLDELMAEMELWTKYW